MSYRDTVPVTLEQWSPTAFLLAGGLFSLPAVADGVHAVTGTAVAVSPAVVFAFLLVVFAGLLGLSPRLAEEDPRLATAGVGLLAVTTATTVPAIGVFVPSLGLPVGKATALAVVITVAVGSTLTVATFGVASLLTGAQSRPVGGFLLAAAAGMALIAGAMLANGHSTPEWVGFLANGLVAASLGSTGYVLRTGAVPAGTPDSTGDATAG